MALFDGGAEEANKEYQRYMQQALDELQAEETRGRGDITSYTQQALGYGAPYREAGERAIGEYQASLGLGGPGTMGAGEAQQRAFDRFRASPGYQYAVQEAMRGAERSAAARGMGTSGAEEAELQRRAEGLASQEYGQYQGRLANLAGLGATAAGQGAQIAYGTGGQLGRLGETYGQLKSQDLGEMGKAAAESTMAGRSILGRTVGALGGAALGFATGGPLGALKGASMGSQALGGDGRLSQWAQPYAGQYASQTPTWARQYL